MQVRVGVASNFLPTAKEITIEFERVYETQVILSSASTGKLYAQISQGAPFDVFLSADNIRPGKLIEQGIGEKGSLFTYAVGQLALFGKQISPYLQVKRQISESDFKFLAIANPVTAPYGVAAKEVLKNLDMWASVQSKMVRGENVSQALQFVISENAELGLVSYSQVKLLNWQSVNFVVVPESLHTPIKQQGIVLRQNNIVAAYVQFLQSSKSREIIQRHGYRLP